MKSVVVGSYLHESGLGSATFTNVPVLFRQGGDISATGSDQAAAQHMVSPGTCYRMDREVAKAFLVTKMVAAQEVPVSFAADELRSFMAFLGVECRELACLLEISGGVMTSVMNQKRSLGGHLAQRLLILLEAEINDAGFARKYLSGLLSVLPESIGGLPVYDLGDEQLGVATAA